MQKKYLYHKRMDSVIWLLLFFAGLIAGIIVVQFQENSIFAGIFSEYFLNQYSCLKIDHERLLRYVGSFRFGQYVFLVCCGALAAAPVILNILICIFGMTIGSVLSVSTVRLGLKGVLICVVGIFPQICFYIPAFGWVLLWVNRRGNNRKKYFLLSASGLFFLVFGILTESYLNPLILQQILRKM